VEKIHTELNKSQKVAAVAEGELSRSRTAVLRQKQEMETLMQKFAATETDFYAMPVDSTRYRVNPAQVPERLRPTNFVVLSLGHFKSNHFGAQGILNPITLKMSYA